MKLLKKRFKDTKFGRTLKKVVTNDIAKGLLSMTPVGEIANNVFEETPTSPAGKVNKGRMVGYIIAVALLTSFAVKKGWVDAQDVYELVKIGLSIFGW